MSAGFVLGAISTFVGGLLMTAGGIGVREGFDPPTVPWATVGAGIALSFLGLGIMHQASREEVQARLGDRAETIAEIREGLRSLDERIEQLFSDMEAYDGEDR